MRIFIADGIFSNLFKLERVDFNFVKIDFLEIEARIMDMIFIILLKRFT